MTAEEFNELPLDARRFIEKQKPCCGRVKDLDALYKSFLIMKKSELYSLRTGAVNFKTKKGKTGVLYPIHPADTEETIQAKLITALAVNDVYPEAFDFVNAEEIEKILKADAKKAGSVKTEKAENSTKTLPKVNADGVPVDKNGKALAGKPLENALAKIEAAKAEQDEQEDEEEDTEEEDTEEEDTEEEDDI